MECVKLYKLLMLGDDKKFIIPLLKEIVFDVGMELEMTQFYNAKTWGPYMER